MNLVLVRALALATAITPAAPAQADEADDHYLQMLQQMDATNINVPSARRQASASCGETPAVTLRRTGFRTGSTRQLDSVITPFQSPMLRAILRIHLANLLKPLESFRSTSNSARSPAEAAVRTRPTSGWHADA
jgi:hypothetical protein